MAQSMTESMTESLATVRHRRDGYLVTNGRDFWFSKERKLPDDVTHVFIPASTAFRFIKEFAEHNGYEKRDLVLIYANEETANDKENSKA